MAVHLLLALYPQLNEHKRIELFNGAHLQWLFYVYWYVFFSFTVNSNDRFIR